MPHPIVIPAQAGIQKNRVQAAHLDSGLRRNDGLENRSSIENREGLSMTFQFCENSVYYLPLYLVHFADFIAEWFAAA